MLHRRPYNDLIINNIPTRWPCKKKIAIRSGLTFLCSVLNVNDKDTPTAWTLIVLHREFTVPLCYVVCAMKQFY